MKLFLGLQLLLLAAPVMAQYNRFSSKYESFGRVFYDANKNGQKEDIETGIGSVTIHDEEGNKAVSRPDGSFSLYTDRKETFIRIKLDLNTLPPGSILTTPPEHYVNLDGSQLSQLDFGMTYPEEETIFGRPHHEKYQYYFSHPYSIKHTFTLKEDGIYFNDNLWLQFSSTEGRKEMQIRFDTNTLIFDEYILKDYLRFLDLNAHQIRQINLLVPDTSDKNIDLLSRELRVKTIRSKVEQQKIFFRKTNRSLDPGVMIAQIEMIKRDLLSEACTLNVLEISQKVGYRDSFVFEADPFKEHKGKVLCDGVAYSFVIPKAKLQKAVHGLNRISDFVYYKDKEFMQLDFETTYKSEVYHDNQLLKNNRFLVDMEDLDDELQFLVQGPDGYKYKIPLQIGIPDILKDKVEDQTPKEYLSLFESRYLKEARDRRLFFRFKGENLHNVTINGHTYTGEETSHIGFNFDGTREDEYNFMKVEYKTASGSKEIFRYDFPVLYESRYFLQASYGTYNFNRNSNNIFSVNSEAKNVRYADVRFRYYPKRWWGLGLSYAWDVDKIILTQLAAPNAKIQTRHNDLKIDLLRRFYQDVNEFNTLKYTGFFGIGYKSFDPGTQVLSFDIPEDILGPHLGGELLIEEAFGKEYIDLSTQLHFILGINDTNNYALQASQELHVNLNKLGKFFGITPYYNHHFRYGSTFQKFRLVFGLHFKLDNAVLANANRGEVRENQYAGTVGLNFQY
ncbi:MAG: hypothetical protein JNM93_03075 [Bacteriovoracaceae bacterium]|nr:hypothetical protein [Bacteriovoracaceae bacterium]